VRRERGREHVIHLIHPENAASIAIARKLGATHERDTEIRGAGCDLHVQPKGTNLTLRVVRNSATWFKPRNQVAARNQVPHRDRRGSAVRRNLVHEFRPAARVTRDRARAPGNRPA
jgi:hypothetical protein